jgi:hypothetical protein
MSNIDQQIQQIILDSVLSVEGTFDWDNVLDIEKEDKYPDDYYIAAEAIMEPIGLTEDMFEWWENITNSEDDQWSGLIKRTCNDVCGHDKWGKLADFIDDDGY